MADKTNEAMIAALLREREGYERSGKQDRVNAVNEQLKMYGYKSDEKEDKEEGAKKLPNASDESRKNPPQGRTADRPGQTTARPEVNPLT